MSVLMGMRMTVDPARFEELAREKAEFMKEISHRGKEMGAIHHQFLAGDGEVIVADEWESAEQFQAFFAAEGERIGALMAEGGVTNQPQPVFLRRLDTADAF
jgi:heme-degrading monooxygenase HmoA